LNFSFSVLLIVGSTRIWHFTYMCLTFTETRYLADLTPANGCLGIISLCRLLPYHVIADYEAEEDDRILDSDTTGQMLSRSQQWDHNIAAKVAEFTSTFEKQALAFNIITRKRALGEFRSEERLMIEQALFQEEKRAMLELKAELESREKAGREA